MLDTLTEWEARCTGVLGEIDAQIAQVKARAREKSRRERRLEEVWEKEREREAKGEDGGMEARGNTKRGGTDAMDIDDEEQENYGGIPVGKHGKKEKGGKGHGMFAGFARKLATG